MTTPHAHCAACPLPAAADCLGRRVPAACVHVGRGRADWRRHVLSQAGHESGRFPRTPAGGGRIRVGFVSAGLCVGGAERHMLCVASWLDPARFDFAGVAIREGGIVQESMSREWERLGIPWAHGPGAIRALYRECDVCYVWGVPAADQLLNERPPTCKVAMVSHGICDWTKAAMADARLADRIVITARASLDTIPEAERHRVELVYNAIDPARLVPRLTRDEQRAAWGISDPAIKVCGNVARVSGEKGCYHAAPMIDELWRYGSKEWRFVWIGPGWETEGVRTRAEGLVPGGVILPGNTDDVGSAHHAMDWYVAPTIDDAHPLSLVEAMIARTPIISAAVGYAAERPDLFRLVPRAPSGWHLAQALAADQADADGTAARVERAHAFAVAELGPARFAREWSAIVEALAPPKESDPAPRCRHRSGRWCCGEGIATCAKGRGQAGIIDPADCRGCPEAEA